MTKLKKPVTLETAFGANVVDELLSEDGACRVGNKRLNIVTVTDHGVARAGAIEGPCNVMRGHQELMQGWIASDGGLMPCS